MLSSLQRSVMTVVASIGAGFGTLPEQMLRESSGKAE